MQKSGFCSVFQHCINVFVFISQIITVSIPCFYQLEHSAHARQNNLSEQCEFLFKTQTSTRIQPIKTLSFTYGKRSAFFIVVLSSTKKALCSVKNRFL